MGDWGCRGKWFDMWRDSVTFHMFKQSSWADLLGVPFTRAQHRRTSLRHVWDPRFPHHFLQLYVKLSVRQAVYDRVQTAVRMGKASSHWKNTSMGHGKWWRPFKEVKLYQDTPECNKIEGKPADTEGYNHHNQSGTCYGDDGWSCLGGGYRGRAGLCQQKPQEGPQEQVDTQPEAALWESEKAELVTANVSSSGKTQDWGLHLVRLQARCCEAYQT